MRSFPVPVLRLFPEVFFFQNATDITGLVMQQVLGNMNAVDDKSGSRLHRVGR